MTQKFSNAARAYLAGGISDSATSITVATGTGATFPEITSPDFARAVLQDANGIEVVLITAHAAGSDSFTVTRAQESTSARAFSAGAVFGLRVTAADAASFAAKQEYLVSGTNIKTINNTSILGAGNIQIDGGVTSFNTRTGAVTLGSSDVTTALGYTPANQAGDTFTGAITSAGASNSGNLTFTGTGNRITGDFSNATVVNRVAFQGVSGTTTDVGSIPPTGATVASFIAFNSTDSSNSAFAQLRIDGGDARFASSKTGTGSYLPMAFYTGGSERVRIDTSGNVGIGTSSPSYNLHVRNGGGNCYSAVQYGTGTIGYLLAANNEVQIRAFNGTNDVLTFATGNTERARIDSSGNLLVGTTSIGASIRFIAKGASTSSGDYTAYFENSTSTLLGFIRNDGAFSTGVASLSPYNLTAGSAANVFVDSGGILYRSTSSLKYKTDVQDSTHGLAKVMQLRSVTYKGKNDGDTIFGGLIAEEVHEIGLTEFVQYAQDGSPDALHYGNMVSLAFKAIQELKAELDTVKAELQSLKGN